MSNKLDETIHQRTRLAIMARLIAAGKSDFATLKNALGLTDGNLSIHTAILEKKELIISEKSFVGRKTRTTFRITPKGLSAFEAYLTELERVLGGS